MMFTSSNISDGRDTPEGKFDITRQEGENYSSGEFPSSDPNLPNMPWSSFFEAPRGIAIHGSLNFITRKRDGKDVDFLRLDNSHGCVNVLKDDARLVWETLTIGNKVVVLP